MTARPARLTTLLLALSVFGCTPPDDSTAVEARTAYDVEITFRGLIGFVPESGDTSPAGNEVEDLWALLVNASEGTGPCAAHGPYGAVEEDPQYLHHFPTLRYDPKNRTDQDQAGDDGVVDLMRYSVALDAGQAKSEDLVRLSAGDGGPCTEANYRSFSCIPAIADFAPYLSRVCEGCLGPVAPRGSIPSSVAARFKVSNGVASVSDIERNNEPAPVGGKSRPVKFRFANTGGYSPEGAWLWQDVQPWLGSQPTDDDGRVVLAKDTVVTLNGVEGPITLLLTHMDDAAADQTIRLAPAGDSVLRIEVLNMTNEALDGSYLPRDWDGRELRWLYKLSDNLPEEEACKGAVLPSLDTIRNPAGPPICPPIILDAGE